MATNITLFFRGKEKRIWTWLNAACSNKNDVVSELINNYWLGNLRNKLSFYDKLNSPYIICHLPSDISKDLIKTSPIGLENLLLVQNYLIPFRFFSGVLFLEGRDMKSIWKLTKTKLRARCGSDKRMALEHFSQEPLSHLMSRAITHPFFALLETRCLAVCKCCRPLSGRKYFFLRSIIKCRVLVT
jgi:hypothetical protein